jgi:DNA-binding response OmpR family regulator
MFQDSGFILPPAGEIWHGYWFIGRDRRFMRLFTVESMMAKTVLVLDKQKVTRGMLRFAMELQGFPVVDAETADEAFAILCRGGVDLLVIGINGDNDDNADMISQVRLHPDLETLPILLVGENHLKSLLALKAFGCCAWLNKPFRMNEIHLQVESLLTNVAPACREQWA